MKAIRSRAAFGAASGLLALFLWNLPLVAQAASAPVVKTQAGSVRGIISGSVREYLGIPYAAPPVGSLRWQPPQPPAAWTFVRDASQPGPACAQPASTFGPQSNSEDCLSLNVYSPNANSAHLPVIVWVHGGAFFEGQGADYDGSALVQAGNVIVVTINYRLGALGFLVHPALSGETADGSSGNYGLMDQQAALGWVKNNIAAFGGDPGNVTLAGQSAGGLSVIAQLASPTAAGLFQQAISESGTFRLSLQTYPEAKSHGLDFARAAGCDEWQGADCLRALPVEAILANQVSGLSPIAQQVAWGPNVSGSVMPRQPLEQFYDGSFNRVPVLMGTNQNEGRFFSTMGYDAFGTPITPEGYPAAVDAITGKLSGGIVLAKYPENQYSSPDIAFGTMFGDSGFSCQGQIIESLLAQKVSTYVYELRDDNAGTVYYPVYSFDYTATHTSDLPFLFPSIQGHEYNLGPKALNADERQLSATMLAQWTRFAASGNPNGGGLPNWPVYSKKGRSLLALTPPVPAAATDFNSLHQCTFWAPMVTLSAMLPPWLTGALL